MFRFSKATEDSTYIRIRKELEFVLEVHSAEASTTIPGFRSAITMHHVRLPISDNENPIRVVIVSEAFANAITQGSTIEGARIIDNKTTLDLPRARSKTQVMVMFHNCAFIVNSVLQITVYNQ